MSQTNAPSSSYGVLLNNTVTDSVDEVVEQIVRQGYAVLDSDYTKAQQASISNSFDQAQEIYWSKHNQERLIALNEQHLIRALLCSNDEIFLDVALNETLLKVIRRLIAGKFILNQQNGITNPPSETYSQGVWHRDLPYQHFISSTPLAINALYCVDDFTVENGATFVLPASHKFPEFPSQEFVSRNAVQVVAPAGCYLLMDCMVFHAGGFNTTAKTRRAINNVFNIPFFKQQINLPQNLLDKQLSNEQKEILGFNYQEPSSVAAYLERAKR